MSTDQQIEQEIVAKGLTAPRVTLAEIDALCDSISIRTHRFEGTNVMVAIALLPDGYMIGHGFSACVSGANFDEQTGFKVSKQHALENARSKLWENERYLLRARLAAEPADFIGRLDQEITQLQERHDKLAAFLADDSAVSNIDFAQEELLTAQLSFMQDYLKTLQQRRALL